MESRKTAFENENGKRLLTSPITPGKRLKQSCLPFKVINPSPKSATTTIGQKLLNPVNEKKRSLSGSNELSAPHHPSKKTNSNSEFSGTVATIASVGSDQESKENELPIRVFPKREGAPNPCVMLKKFFVSTASAVVNLDSTDDDNTNMEDGKRSDVAVPVTAPLRVSFSDGLTPENRAAVVGGGGGGGSGSGSGSGQDPTVVLTEADTTTSDLSPSKLASALNTSVTDTDGEKSSPTFSDQSPCSKTIDNISIAIEAAVSGYISSDVKQLSSSANNNSPSTKSPEQQRKKKLTKRKSDPSVQLEREKLQQEKIKAQLEKERLKAELRRLKDESRRQRDQEKAERAEKKAQEESLKLEKLQLKDEEKKRKQEALAAKLDEKQKKEQERLEKEDEKRKCDEDKKKLNDEEQQKRAKAKAAFVGFFVRKNSAESPLVDKPGSLSHGPNVSNGSPGHFLPFQVKKDVKLAPLHRNSESNTPGLIRRVDTFLTTEVIVPLYLEQLKLRGGCRKRCRAKKTWQSGEVDVAIIDDGRVTKRCRLLQFCDNVRPAYWGTWSKKSALIGPRTPFNKDSSFLDYEVDSDDEWEEEEVGESLSNSEGEKESEDDYEVDNEFFVPHGYLSDEEAQDEEQIKLSPDRFKARLELKEEEFQKELKKKYQQIKPRVIGCVWVGDKTLGADKMAKALEQYSAVLLSVGPIETCLSQQLDISLKGENKNPESSSDMTEGSKKSIKVAKQKMNVELFEKVMPSFIKLVHGSTHGKNTLFKEFKAFVAGIQAEESMKDVPDVSETETCVPPPVESVSKTPFLSVGRMKKVLQQIATYGRFPEPGPIYNEMAWCVAPEVLRKHDLTDLPIPNAWQFRVAVPTVVRVGGGGAGEAGASVPTKQSSIPAVAASATPEPVMLPKQKRPLPTDFFRKKCKLTKVEVKPATLDHSEGQQELDHSCVDLTEDDDVTICLD